MADSVKNKNILGTYEGEALDTNITNLNGLDITRDVIENVLASDEYQKGIEAKWYLGYLGHPEDPLCADFKNACITMTDMSIDDDGKVYAKFDLLDTPVGRIVKTMQEAGVVFGISIRGAGDIVGSSVDPDTFMFRGFDLVAFPAYPDSVPEFIAASTDPMKRKKYQAICAAVNKDIDNIDSVEAIDIIQSQFAPQSDEYKVLEKRKEDIQSEETLNIDEEKVEAMTDLYLESQDVIAEQDREIRELREEKRIEVSAAERKMSAVKRITASQMSDIRVSLDKAVASRDMYKTKYISASKKLEAAEKSNLIYMQKIEAAQAKHDTETKRKDSIIASLRSEVRKTVAASRNEEKAASDLGADNERLSAELESCQANLRAYQEAYASIYAHALGVSFDSMQISSSMSVDELQQMISGSTNSVNITPSVTVMDGMFIDDDDNGDLITL